MSHLLDTIFTDQSYTTKMAMTLRIILVLCAASSSPVLGLVYNMDESLPIGSPIGNIARDAGLKKQEEIHGGLKFNLLPHGYIHTSLFSVDDNTSELQTASEIDREELCGVSVPCVLDIVVGVLSKSGNFFQIVPVQVVVRDINDNAPMFPQPVLKVLIPESALPGMYYNVPTAIDLDIGNNSIQKYELLTESELFSLHTSRNSDQTIDISIVLNTTLDREKAAYYQLHLLAKDGGSPPKTGTGTINVTVTDVNDHKPQFVKKQYVTSHPENTPLGSTLIKVTAHDSDFGANGRVTYYFGLHTSRDIMNVLSINETSGEIKLRQSLDYELKKQYQFVVGATDHGSQPQTTQTSVVINVEDVNDNVPSLHFNLLSGGNFAMLAEDAGQGSFIAHLSVADGDSGRNGQVNCSVVSPGFELHRLLANEYKVLLNSTLDREIKSEHQVSIVCHDGGEPHLTGTGQVNVKVSDVNDNAPIFKPEKYNMELSENNRGDEFIAHVSATDKDEDVNGKITYSLGSHQDNFVINNESGVIKAKPGLDREKFPNIDLLVLATDQGKPPLSSTTTVHINLLDINDMTPSFTESQYHLYIMEEQNSGTFVGRMHAEDKDEGRNGQVKYSLLKAPSMDLPFLLNSETGALETEKALDRETQASYTFIVAATDDGKGEQLYSMVNVTVHVTDANDNFPEFSYPTTSDNIKVIYHTDYVGTLVAQVSAHDPDSGENATIVFKIVNGNAKNLFQIHPTTGEIFVINQMSEEDIGNHILSISASDQGHPSKEKLAQFEVDILLGNGTFLSATNPSRETPSFDNLIIGVTIAVTTVLLALIITVIIILVRKRSKRPSQFPRAESQHMMAYGDNGFGVVPHQPQIATQAAMPRPGDICRQVNFSMTNEGSTSHPGSSFSTFKGENSISKLDHTSLQQPKACSSILTINAQSPGKVETVLTQNTSPKSQHQTAISPQRSSLRGSFQSMNRWSDSLQNSTYTIIQANERYDNNSDMSGEITNSDSGRGGSEEELPTPLNKSTKDNSKTSVSSAKPKKRVQLIDPVLTEEPNIHQRIKRWMAEHDPESAYFQINVDPHGNYPLPSEYSGAATQSGAKSPPQSSYMPPSILKNSPRHRSYQQHPHAERTSLRNIPIPVHNIAPADILAMSGIKSSDFNLATGVFRHRMIHDDESDVMTESVRDDDDGETTTSGSYVINAEDLCNEINDLFFNDSPNAVEI